MYRDKLEIWLESPYIDENIKEELRSIEKIDSEIEDRSINNLEFGTGGMRAKLERVPTESTLLLFQKQLRE